MKRFFESRAITSLNPVERTETFWASRSAPFLSTPWLLGTSEASSLHSAARGVWCSLVCYLPPFSAHSPTFTHYLVIDDIWVLSLLGAAHFFLSFSETSLDYHKEGQKKADKGSSCCVICDWSVKVRYNGEWRDRVHGLKRHISYSLWGNNKHNTLLIFRIDQASPQSHLQAFIEEPPARTILASEVWAKLWWTLSTSLRFCVSCLQNCIA